MANIQIVVNSRPTRRGEHTVSFEVSIGSTKKRFTTGLRISAKGLTKDLKVKDIRILNELERKRLDLLDRICALEIRSIGERDLTAAYVVEKILMAPVQKEFFAYADHWLENCKLKGKRNYITSLRKFEEFLGKRYIPFAEITYTRLKQFEDYLSGTRAASLYIGSIRHIFREAMKELNNEFEKCILDDPFQRYIVPKQKPRTTVRALELDQLLALYEYKGQPGGRAQLARDCFILSFCLMGMNAADMYECSYYANNVIKYDRMKTRDRRSDNAHMEVNVHPFIKKLINKHRGTTGRVFNFSRRFATLDNFNRALNRGLKEIGKEIGVPNISFYFARHTFATLSRNLMRFAKSDVDEALNHIGELGLADIYIKKDYSIINDNNFALIDKVFAKYMK